MGGGVFHPLFYSLCGFQAARYCGSHSTMWIPRLSALQNALNSSLCGSSFAWLLETKITRDTSRQSCTLTKLRSAVLLQYFICEPHFSLAFCSQQICMARGFNHCFPSSLGLGASLLLAEEPLVTLNYKMYSFLFSSPLCQQVQYRIIITHDTRMRNDDISTQQIPLPNF